MTVLPVSEQRLAQLIKRYGQPAHMLAPLRPNRTHPWRLDATDESADTEQADDATVTAVHMGDAQPVFVLIEARRAVRHADVPQDSETADALLLITDSDAPPQQAARLRLTDKSWHVLSAVPASASARLVFRVQMSLVE